MVAFLAPLLGAVGAIGAGLIASSAQKSANNQSIAAATAAQNLSYEQTLALQNLAYQQNRELAAQAQGYNKELYDYTTPDLASIRDRATEAGFNPLTVLGSSYATGQAGGMSGGGMSGGQIAPVVPQLASQSFLADAVRDSSDIFAREVTAEREYERRVIERREDFERELELNKSFNVPQGTSGYSLAEVKPPKLGPTAAMSDDGTLPATLPLKVAGQDFSPGGWFSDAESVETRYGDAASWVYGAGAGLADLGFNAGQVLAKGKNRAVAALRGYGPVMSVGGKDFALYRPPALAPLPMTGKASGRARWK